ncbi:unnamed protein product [Hapterophycus canaliculatus]
MRRKQSTGPGAVSNHDVYDTDPPRAGRLLGYPAAAGSTPLAGTGQAFLPYASLPGTTSRGMSFPGAAGSAGPGGGASAGGAGGIGSSGAGGGGVAGGDVDMRIRESQKSGKKGVFKDWKRR